MKHQSTPGPVIQLNFRRLLLFCMAALAVLAFARPGLANDLPAGKTAEPAKDSPVDTVGSGLEASLGTAAAASSQSTNNCPFVKCLVTCDNGLGHTEYFTDTLSCYSHSEGPGCRASGIFVCSDKPDPDVKGC